MNLYFEVLRTVDGTIRYYSISGLKDVYDLLDHDHLPHPGIELLTTLSTRIWNEEGTKVEYTKCPFDDMGVPIDMEEFFWIKLKSMPYYY